MEIDSKTWDAIVVSIGPAGSSAHGAVSISADEARAIVQIAELASGVDLRQDPSENALLDTVTRGLCAGSGIARDTIPPISPLPVDEEDRITWANRLANHVKSTHGKELAYAVGYLLVVADLELAPAESNLLEALRSALAIPQARADELVSLVSAAMTPGVSG